MILISSIKKSSYFHFFIFFTHLLHIIWFYFYMMSAILLLLPRFSCVACSPKKNRKKNKNQRIVAPHKKNAVIREGRKGEWTEREDWIILVIFVSIKLFLLFLLPTSFSPSIISPLRDSYSLFFYMLRRFYILEMGTLFNIM